MPRMNDKPPNYFEGILQLRDVSQEVVDFVEERCIGKGRHMVAKVKSVRNGFDFYIQSNKYLAKLGRLIADTFKGELVKTATLHTRDNQSSKDLYRLTVLFRQHRIKKGDLIRVNGDEYVVTGISKKINVKEKASGRKRIFSFEELRKAHYQIIHDEDSP